MSIGMHCPDCGAITKRVREDDGWESEICTNDDCPRIVVAVVAMPAPLPLAKAKP